MKASEARKLTEEVTKPVGVEEHLNEIYKVIARNARDGKCFCTFNLISLHFANLATRSEVVRSLEANKYNTTLKDNYLTVEW